VSVPLGGMGRISFFDLQKGGWRPSPKNLPYLEIGSGWVAQDTNYAAHFANMFTPNAVYTHCYDPSQTKLFAAGGPLMLGLKGSYAAIW